MRTAFKQLIGITSLLDYIQDVDLSYGTGYHDSNINELLEEKGFSKIEIEKLMSLFNFEKKPMYRVFTSSERRVIDPEVRDYIQKMHLLGVPAPILMDEIIDEIVTYSARIRNIDDAKTIITSFMMGNGSRGLHSLSNFYDHSH